jgi:hypothetical protein
MGAAADLPAESDTFVYTSAAMGNSSAPRAPEAQSSLAASSSGNSTLVKPKRLKSRTHIG